METKIGDNAMENNFNYRPIIFVEKHIQNTMKILAFHKSTCLRKSVGASIEKLVNDNGSPIIRSIFGFNGPSVVGNQCTNVVGNCGCSHAEPRAILQALQDDVFRHETHCLMICTYSPCTTCANIILDSGLVSHLVFDILTEHDKRGYEFLKSKIEIVSLKEIEEDQSDAFIKTLLQLNNVR